MPRARDKNKFRRGSDQKYNKVASHVHRSVRKSDRAALHIPVTPLLAMFCAITLIVMTTLNRSAIGNILSSIDYSELIPQLSLPQISLPQISFDISIPDIQLPKIQLPTITLPRWDIMPVVAMIVAALTALGSSVMTLCTAALSGIIWVITAIGTYLTEAIGMLVSYVLAIDLRPIFVGLQKVFSIIWNAAFQSIYSIADFANPVRTFSIAFMTQQFMWGVLFSTLSTVLLFIWQGTVITSMFLFSVIRTVVFFLYTILTSIVLALVQVVIVMGSFIVGIFHAIGKAFSDAGKATEQSVHYAADTASPYVAFISNGVRQTWNDLGAGFSKMGDISKDLVDTYNHNSAQ